GFHRPFAVVPAGGLHVPVVEAAATVEVAGAHHHVFGLCVVPVRGPRGRVVPVPDPRDDVDAVHLLAADGDGGGLGVRFVVRGWVLVRGGRHGEMVAVTRLVVDERDGAAADAAEGVLIGRARQAARGDDADVLDRAVRLANLVEEPVVRAVERSHRAVGRHARAAVGGVDVARPHGGGGSAAGAHVPGGGRRRRASRRRAAAPGRTARPRGGPAVGRAPRSARVARGQRAADAARAEDRGERDPVPTIDGLHREAYFPYPAAWTFVKMEVSVESDGWPFVMAPS